MSQGPAWAVVDGGSTLGQAASVFPMETAIAKARGAGIAYVGIRNSNHFGAAGYYAWLAARDGLIGIAMANDIPSMAAPGSRKAVTGSNPIAFAVPAGKHPPILLDMATAAVAGGKVYAARSRGLPIPPTWLIEIKPSWTIRIQAPDDYTVVALGGRHVRTEKHEGSTISEWRSVRPIYPQLMAGRFQKHAVPGGSAQVVFYLPKGYDHGLVPRIGKELSAAYEIFRDMFGPLEGDEIHIGVSSAGQGGHGGYLSFTMDTGMLGREITEERLPMILEIMRHELAHSWWGWSVSSYGPGTKFLRESLAHFANACFVEETTRQDRLAADMAKLFWMGMQTDVLCGPDTDSERAAYLKGPVVLHVLRSEMGREKFSAVLRRFASRHHGDWATMTDFIATCNEVSGTDWTEFFNQWCFGAGIPDYRLEKLDSQKHGDAWTTEITIRNAGGATITCPLELRMAEGNLRKTFRIEPSKASTLTFPSPKEVIQAVIDPDHRTCQGSGRECRLKMLGVGNVDMEWIWYWRGVVLAEDGKYREAIADITRAMALHGHPAFSYSRGVAYLKSGDTRPARSDFVDFIDAIVKRNDAHRSLVYPGLLSAKEDTQKEQLNRILQALTGQRFTTHDQWQSWWHAHRESFQPAPSASLLAPGGESA